MEPNRPRFNLYSFQYTISLDMNIECAKLLHNLIRDQEDVDAALFAISEKIRHQFYRMNKLSLIDGVNDSSRNKESTNVPNVPEPDKVESSTVSGKSDG
jgi:hypothetical protein